MRPWGRTGTDIRPAEAADCEALAEIHASAFRRGWSDAEMESLLLQPGVHAVIAHQRRTFGGPVPAGFVIYRLVADEAEILSVAVDPDFRRRGIGRLVMEDALRHLYREGAARVHLEVEDSNLAAIALYQGMEFHESGRRKGYYTQARATPGSALVMVRQLR